MLDEQPHHHLVGQPGIGAGQAPVADLAAEHLDVLGDPAFRDRLSDEVVVRLLIEHGIITAADLGRLNDPAWCSRQEDLWWTQAS